MSEVCRWLVIVGVLVALFGQLRLVLTAFGESALKGILCLVIPGYVVFHAWRDERTLLGIWLGGVGLVVLAMVLAP